VSIWGVATAADFSPDGRYLALTNSIGDVVLLGGGAGAPTKLGRHLGWVFCARFSRDGRFLYTSGGDRAIKVWDVEGRREVRTLVGHERGVMCVAPSGDGRLLVSCGQDGTVRTWGLLAPAISRAVPRRSRGYAPVAMSADGALLLMGDGARLGLYDLGSGRLRHDLAWEAGPGDQAGDVRAVAMTADGRFGVSGHARGVIRVWNLGTGRLVTAFDGHGRGEVRSVAVSADGARVASGGADGRVVAWDVTGSRALGSSGGYTAWNYTIRFSPDGREILFPRGTDVCVWRGFDGPDGTIVPLRGHEYHASCVAMSADGRYLLSGGWDHVGRIWDAHTGDVLVTLSGHGEFISDVAFAAGGRRAVTVGGDKTVRIWDTASGREWKLLERHSSPVRGLAVSADGDVLVTSDDDGGVYQWDLSRGRRTLELEAVVSAAAAATERMAGGELDGVTLAAVGERYAAAGSHDHAVEMFLLARARGAAVDGLILAKSYWALGREAEAAAEAKGRLVAVAAVPEAATRPVAVRVPAAPAAGPVATGAAGKAFTRANDLARLGRYKEAAGAWEAFVGKDPASPRDYYWLAGLQLAAGDVDAYRRACASMAGRVTDDSEPVTMRLLVKMSVWHGGTSAAEAGKLIPMARRVVERDGDVHTSWQTLGAAQLRAGAPGEAYESFRTAFAKPNPFPYACAEPQTELLTAIALWRLDRTREAAEAANRGRAMLKRQEAEIRKRPLNNGMGDVILCELLIKEFEGMSKAGAK
jgi:WD40 repeat protein